MLEYLTNSSCKNNFCLGVIHSLHISCDHEESYDMYYAIGQNILGYDLSYDIRDEREALGYNLKG